MAVFRTFLAIGLLGFGGVMPWAQRVLVEDKRWLTPREFLEILSLAQLVPGPNIVNVSVTVGMRYFGVAGASMAVLGLMAMPMVIIFGLILLFDLYGDLPVVDAAFRGVSSSAAGLLVALAIKLAWPLLGKIRMVSMGAIVLLAVAAFRLPLLPVLAAVLPVSLLWAWIESRGR